MYQFNQFILFFFGIISITSWDIICDHQTLHHKQIVQYFLTIQKTKSIIKNECGDQLKVCMYY